MGMTDTIMVSSVSKASVSAVSSIDLLLENVLIKMILGKTEDAVQSEARAYYVPIMVSFPFLAVFNATTAISRSNRKTLRTMLVSVLINLINIGGN